MAKHKLDLELVLPNDAAHCHACVDRLTDVLSRQSGIVKVHVDQRQPSAAKLCLHYDPTVLRLERVEALAKSAGAAVDAGYDHVSLPALGLRHERHARIVEELLARQRGVAHVSVAFGAQRIYVEFDPRQTNSDEVSKTAARAGIASYDKTKSSADAEHPHDSEQHEHGGPFGERSELVFSLVCGALTLGGWALEKSSTPDLVVRALFVAAYVFGSWFTLQEVAIALRARKFEIDFLMLLAAAGAALLGEWFEGALLLFLFTLGHALEGYAMGKARNAIAALTKLVPETALRLDEAGAEREVSIAELMPGDRIVVKPNTRLPADGVVVEGNSSVNQAPVTGESVPVDKRPADDVAAALGKPESVSSEHRVFAGSINGKAALTVAVTKMASESTLARVAKLVAEAETQKSQTQQFTDRFERIFVPVILVVVLLLHFAWVVLDETFAQSFYRAMAVLVAASPCALAIATPSAVLSGVARAARGGVLIKGGVHLESLGVVQIIAFDKTGTLTEGKPRLTDVMPVSTVSEDDLLRTAVAIEKRSDHPLASAIVKGGADRLADNSAPDVQDVEAIIGYGVRGVSDGNELVVAKPAFFKDALEGDTELSKVTQHLQNAGRTVMVVKLGDRFLGALGVMDAPRESARVVIAELHRLGVKQTLMLTGDNQRVAEAVAEQVGIKVAKGDLLPEHKVEAIAALARGKTPIAMVGDGVNDAPAMANATVGIAMGAGGSDVALETADVALMADDLHSLPFALGLSRASRRIIRQNLWASLGMVAFLVPATIFGFAGIGAAVALHEGSTLLVVLNALRLLAYPDATRSNAS